MADSNNLVNDFQSFLSSPKTTGQIKKKFGEAGLNLLQHYFNNEQVKDHYDEIKDKITYVLKQTESTTPEPPTQYKAPENFRAYLQDKTLAKAVNKYTGTSYHGLNFNLRKNQDLPKALEPLHKDLQKAFASVPPLEKPIEVYRGLGMNETSFLSKIKEHLETGTTFEDRGYSSATMDKEVASRFGNFVFKIKARHGIDAAPVSRHPGEQEVLLPPSSYKVLGHSKEEERYVVELEQFVPEKKSSGGSVGEFGIPLHFFQGGLILSSGGKVETDPNKTTFKNPVQPQRAVNSPRPRNIPQVPVVADRNMQDHLLKLALAAQEKYRQDRKKPNNSQEVTLVSPHHPPGPQQVSWFSKLMDYVADPLITMPIAGAAIGTYNTLKWLGFHQGGQIPNYGGIVPGGGNTDQDQGISLPAGSIVLNTEATKLLEQQNSPSMSFHDGGAVPVHLQPGERVILPHEIDPMGGKDFLLGVNQLGRHQAQKMGDGGEIQWPGKLSKQLKLYDELIAQGMDKNVVDDSFKKYGLEKSNKKQVASKQKLKGKTAQGLTGEGKSGDEFEKVTMTSGYKSIKKGKGYVLVARNDDSDEESDNGPKPDQNALSDLTVLSAEDKAAAERRGKSEYALEKFQKFPKSQGELSTLLPFLKKEIPYEKTSQSARSVIYDIQQKVNKKFGTKHLIKTVSELLQEAYQDELIKIEHQKKLQEEADKRKQEKVILAEKEESLYTVPSDWKDPSLANQSSATPIVPQAGGSSQQPPNTPPTNVAAPTPDPNDPTGSAQLFGPGNPNSPALNPSPVPPPDPVLNPIPVNPKKIVKGFNDYQPEDVASVLQGLGVNLEDRPTRLSGPKGIKAKDYAKLPLASKAKEHFYSLDMDIEKEMFKQLDQKEIDRNKTKENLEDLSKSIFGSSSSEEPNPYSPFPSIGLGATVPHPAESFTDSDGFLNETQKKRRELQDQVRRQSEIQASPQLQKDIERWEEMLRQEDIASGNVDPAQLALEKAFASLNAGRGGGPPNPPDDPKFLSGSGPGEGDGKDRSGWYSTKLEEKLQKIQDRKDKTLENREDYRIEEIAHGTILRSADGHEQEKKIIEEGYRGDVERADRRKEETSIKEESLSSDSYLESLKKEYELKQQLAGLDLKKTLKTQEVADLLGRSPAGLAQRRDLSFGGLRSEFFDSKKAAEDAQIRRGIAATPEGAKLQRQINYNNGAAQPNEFEERKKQRQVAIGQAIGEFGTPMGLVVGNLKTLGSQLEEFGQKANRIFGYGAAAIGGMVAAASPDAWSTLTGSFRLLSAVIGMEFLPITLRISGAIQKLVIQWLELDPAIKRNIATWATWGVGIAGGIAVLGKFGTALNGLGNILSLSFRHPLIALITVTGIWLQQTGRLIPTLEAIAGIVDSIGRSFLGASSSTQAWVASLVLLGPALLGIARNGLGLSLGGIGSFGLGLGSGGAGGFRGRGLLGAAGVGAAVAGGVEIANEGLGLASGLQTAGGVSLAAGVATSGVPYVGIGLMALGGALTAASIAARYFARSANEAGSSFVGRSGLNRSPEQLEASLARIQHIDRSLQELHNTPGTAPQIQELERERTREYETNIATSVRDRLRSGSADDRRGIVLEEMERLRQLRADQQSNESNRTRRLESYFSGVPGMPGEQLTQERLGLTHQVLTTGVPAQAGFFNSQQSGRNADVANEFADFVRRNSTARGLEQTLGRNLFRAVPPELASQNVQFGQPRHIEEIIRTLTGRNDLTEISTQSQILSSLLNHGVPTANGSLQVAGMRDWERNRAVNGLGGIIEQIRTSGSHAVLSDIENPPPGFPREVTSRTRTDQAPYLPSRFVGRVLNRSDLEELETLRRSFQNAPTTTGDGGGTARGWFGRRMAGAAEGRGAESLAAVINTNFRPQQLQTEQLIDMIQNEAVRAPLDQARFLIEQKSLEELIRLNGGLEGSRAEMLKWLEKVSNRLLQMNLGAT